MLLGVLVAPQGATTLSPDRALGGCGQANAASDGRARGDVLQAAMLSSCSALTTLASPLNRIAFSSVFVWGRSLLFLAAAVTVAGSFAVTPPTGECAVATFLTRRLIISLIGSEHRYAA